MLRVACLLLMVTITVGLQLQSKITNQWQKFKSFHGKRYSGEEEVRRREIFKKNVETILLHNLRSDLGEFSYTEGINEFSDMDHEEFVHTMLGLSVPLNDNISSEVMIPSAQVSAPESLDWRSLGAVTPVKNQVSCGSCWAFAAVGTIEGAWFTSHKELVVLSEQQLVDCSSNQKYRNNGCDGGWPQRALKYVIANGGINAESCYRYQARMGTCAYKSDCKNVKISKFIRVPRGDEDALLQAVAENGPIAVAVNAKNWDFMNYRAGVYSPPSCSSDLIDHAVTLVGYGTENGKAYWLIKNSWGTSWGNRGYMKLARNQENMCGIASSASYAVA